MQSVYIVVGVVVLLWFVGGILRNAQRRTKIIRVIDSNCTGCGRCLKACRHRVLALADAENGKRLVVKNPDKCTACGDCVGRCKLNALNLGEKRNQSI